MLNDILCMRYNDSSSFVKLSPLRKTPPVSFYVRLVKFLNRLRQNLSLFSLTHDSFSFLFCAGFSVFRSKDFLSLLLASDSPLPLQQRTRLLYVTNRLSSGAVIVSVSVVLGCIDRKSLKLFFQLLISEKKTVFKYRCLMTRYSQCENPNER